MRLFFRIFFAFVFITTGITALGYFIWYRPKFNHNIKRVETLKKSEVSAVTIVRLRQKASQLKKFNEANQYDSRYCFLVDMRVAAGKKRFFVYNLAKDSIEIAGLVAHGSGSDNGNDELVFSNQPNSNCTSLGRYKIGNSYNGKFGLAFKLYGLDRSNNRAFDRFVVLHAHDCVPEQETDPLPICESWGCPTVSPAFLKVLKQYINDTEKPIILWIYY